MKNLLKSKKLLAIISGIVALMLIITVFYVMDPHNESSLPDVSSETSTIDSTKDIVIETPENTDVSNAEGNTTSEIKDDGNALKPNENVSDSSSNKAIGEKAKDTTSAVKVVDPPKSEDKSDNSGIQIGGDETNSKYNCGSPNHHCHNEDAHAWILNLELEGCSYCGSHSCPSFYAVDEWGNACYTPSKCPKYDVKKDAAEYCQVCGKKNGNGDNDTCQKWIIDFTCPTCGELVEANKCHTH